MAKGGRTHGEKLGEKGFGPGNLRRAVRKEGGYEKSPGEKETLSEEKSSEEDTRTLETEEGKNPEGASGSDLENAELKGDSERS